MAWYPLLRSYALNRLLSVPFGVFGHPCIFSPRIKITIYTVDYITRNQFHSLPGRCYCWCQHCTCNKVANTLYGRCEAPPFMAHVLWGLSGYLWSHSYVTGGFVLCYDYDAQSVCSPTCKQSWMCYTAWAPAPLEPSVDVYWARPNDELETVRKERVVSIIAIVYSTAYVTVSLICLRRW